MRKPLVLVIAVATLAGCQRAQEPAVMVVVTKRCGEPAVSAEFTERERAVLTIGERKSTLTSVPAAASAKYADGEGNEFWTKGLDEGLLTLAGEAPRSCRPAAN